MKTQKRKNDFFSFKKKLNTLTKSGLSLILVVLLIAAYNQYQEIKESLLPSSGVHGVIEAIKPSNNNNEGSGSAEAKVNSSSPQSQQLSIENAINTVNGPYKVERVVDGDTYIINIDGKGSTKVRLIGVDTPESVARGSKASANCEEGKRASFYVKQLIEGNNVFLEYDVTREDRYGRTLAYVYIDGYQLEKTLLEKGYARTMTIPPNIQYADIYTTLQSSAKEKSVGFWKTNPWD